MSSLEIVNRSRRRLSVMGGATKEDQLELDGKKQTGEEDHAEIIRQVLEQAEAEANQPKEVYKSFFSLSKVGFVPFNPYKVNQDRACEVAPFGKHKERAFFGVFDGHGQNGHLVSQHVATTLPKYVARARDLDTNPPPALSAAFVACNSELATSGKIDCTFSGTTAVACYFDGPNIYCCNVGDSRAVIGRVSGDKLRALPLSSDHKPDREDERRRIIASNGRVEACRTAAGTEIGPARVWLKTQDVPGLAMTRSFGDLVAASVGVLARPEIETHTLDESDRFLIMGSDGIWEFITSQEAVDIVAEAESPREACELLLAEADRRWRNEEEVVDDITALVIFF
jgi:serine/threonine protein phosphatase PrpC